MRSFDVKVAAPGVIDSRYIKQMLEHRFNNRGSKDMICMSETNKYKNVKIIKKPSITLGKSLKPKASRAKQLSSTWKEREVAKFNGGEDLLAILKTVNDFLWNWDIHIKMLFYKYVLVFLSLDVR